MRQILFFLFIIISFLAPAQNIEVIKIDSTEYLVTRDTSTLEPGVISVIYKPVKNALSDLERLQQDLEREIDFYTNKRQEIQELIRIRQAKIKDIKKQKQLIQQRSVVPPVDPIEITPPKKQIEPPPVKKAKKAKKTRKKSKSKKL